MSVTTNTVKLIRCCTCGNILGDKYAPFENYISKFKAEGDAKRITYLTSTAPQKTNEAKCLDLLGLNNLCCRNVMLTQVAS